MSKDIEMGVRKGTVVLFVPTLFGFFWGIPSLYAFTFFYYVFLGLVSVVFLCGGDIELLTPNMHACTSYSGDI